MKEIEVRFDKVAYSEYEKLKNNVENNKKSRFKPTYQQLLSSIDEAILCLKENPHYGNLIPRKYFDKTVIARYGTNKLFRIELVGYWRMIYTLVGYETKIIAFVLEYMNHDDYNKIFKYKKR